MGPEVGILTGSVLLYRSSDFHSFFAQAYLLLKLSALLLQIDQAGVFYNFHEALVPLDY